MKTAELLPTLIGTASPNIAVYPKQSGWYPYSVSIVNGFDVSLSHKGNNALHSRQIQGEILPCYFNDFYFRVHTSPTELILGNIVSTQEFKAYVWNGNFQAKRLTKIKGLSEGITFIGKQAPYLFKPLEEQLYKVTVSTQGASSINDTVIFVIGNETPSIFITGKRVVAFNFLPNWTEDGITERLEWSTDILQSASGIEQRSALYLSPRRYFNADFIIYANDKQRFNNMMSWGARIWAIPLWPYLQTIKTALKQGDLTIPCITKNMEFKEDTLIILWRDTNDYEVAEIAAINSDSLTLKRPLLANWTKGTRLYPARPAEFNKQPELTHKTDRLQTFTLEFRLTEPSLFEGIAPTSYYLDYPVLELRPDWSGDLTSQYQRLLSTLDNGMALPCTTDTSSYSFYIQGYRWLGCGREERAAYKSLLYFLNGQQKALWLPSFSDDLSPIGIIAETEAFITIKECGYTTFANGDPDKKHIAIYLTDGRIFYRQIVNSDIKGATERLALNASLGERIEAKQITRISYMRLCRSNSDSVEINHITDSQGVAKSNLTFIRVRDNEL